MKRVLTAAALIPVVIALIFWGPHLVLRAGLAVVAALCLHEFLRLVGGYGVEPVRLVAYAAGGWVVLSPATPGLAFLLGVTLVLLALSMRRGKEITGSLNSTAATLLGIVYACVPFRLAGDLHTSNPHWLFFVLLLNWVGDSAAYYAGRALGRHKLAPRISPAKTWEGAAASLLASAALGVFYLRRFLPDQVSPAFALGLSVAVSVTAQVGDLAESALKRGAGVKDSGRILPGHGGMLDRLDGVLFSVPAAWALTESIRV